MPAPLALDPAAARWSDSAADAPLLVLLHGYGADENDLFGLAPLLADGFGVVAPRAPLSPPWPAPGYSWYSLEGADGGLDIGTAERGSGAVTTAASALLAWLADVAPSRRVGLLGFSQGGAVALQSLRLDPGRIEFVVNLAGYVAPGALPEDASLAARRPPVFWGRGAVDPIIPGALVDHTAQWLPSRVELSGRVYPGVGHAVSEEEIADVARFLAARRVAPST